MKNLTFFFWICILAAVSAIEPEAATITSGNLKLALDEKAGTVEITGLDSQKVLCQNLDIGSVLLPGKEAPLKISKTDFSGMEIKTSGNDRLDLVLPSSDKKFHLALKLSESMLTVVFDSNPVQELWSIENHLPAKEESLDLLKAPDIFKEVKLFPELISLQPKQKGILVFPYQEGTIADFSNPIKQSRVFPLFENSGFTMPFWGVSTPEQTIVCIIDYLYTRIQYQASDDSMSLCPLFANDPYHYPIRMQFHFLGEGKTYTDIAKKYRQYLLSRNELPSLKKKLQNKPELINLLEGVNIKYPLYMRLEQKPDKDGKTPPPVEINYQRFEDVKEWLDEMSSVKRLMAIWWGWGKDGYDRLHPDILPPNPKLGGEKTMIAMTKALKDKGFSVGFHDNYTDIYEAAPSFENGVHCTVGADGKNLKGGFWAGGWCWLLCSEEGLHYAKHNFAQMAGYGLDACFIDVLTAAPLFDCYSPLHPHSKWGDMKNKLEMMKLASHYFGIFGTEHGFSWGAELCDYLEGVSSDPYAKVDWTKPVGTAVPLFSLVYHDGVLQYMHQGCTIQPNMPERFLINLRNGGATYYNIVRSAVNTPVWKDYFAKTYSVASNTIKRTWQSPMTSHTFLTDDKTVEMSEYGDGVKIIINRSGKEFEGTIDRDILGNSKDDVKIVLAPKGFLVSTPDYAALQGSSWGDFKMDKTGWYELEPQTPGKSLIQAEKLHLKAWQEIGLGEDQVNLDKKPVVLEIMKK